jgi:integrase
MMMPRNSPNREPLTHATRSGALQQFRQQLQQTGRAPRRPRHGSSTAGLVPRVPLGNASLSSTTVTRYKKAVQQFINYCHIIGTPPISTISSLDQVLAEYMNDLYYDLDGTMSQASCALYGIQFLLPSTHRLLPISTRTFEGWVRLQPALSYPPLTYELTVAIALTMAKNRFVPHAIATLLAFDGYLRINEFCRLRVSDISFPGDNRVGSALNSMALRLSHTKTGRNQFVTIRSPAVVSLLQDWVAFRVGSSRTRAGSSRILVFGFAAETYRSVFKLVCDGLGLARTGYVPHSLRHGGATRDFLLGATIEQVLFRGRWASTKSARTYLQSGRALLLGTQVPPQLFALASALSTDVLHHLQPLLQQYAAYHQW